MEVIKSNKGGDKLCYCGYMYVLHRTCKEFLRWRCSKATSFKCKASLSTSLSKTNPDVIREHNHPADEESVNVVKIIENMKTKAKDTMRKPTQIFAEAVLSLDNGTRSRMPLENSIKRTLRNQKSKDLPHVPATLEDLLIEGDWTTTGGVTLERFLLSDNGPDAEERIIIFSTDASLQILTDSEEWYMDGNFSLAPPLFLQLYVIRVRTRGLLVTAVYCLLQKKTLHTYECLFQKLMEKCGERGLYPDPQFIHVDFEKACIQAIRSVLGGNVIIRGCFYHLTQNTYRKIQELGLATLYKENEQLNHFCSMIDALAFLPLKDVSKGMDYLKEVVPEEAEDLLDYFDRTYVTGTFRRVGNAINGVLRLRNVGPPFPVELWNVHEATIQGQDRTNNQTEGWNHWFSNLVGENHPSVWKLILKMRLELAADKNVVL